MSEPRPKGIRRPKSAARERVAMPGRAIAATYFHAAVTGGAPGVEAHHCLTGRFIRDAAWRDGLRGEAYWNAVFDPRVAIPLSKRAHERHTNRVEVIPFETLPPELVAYVAERWGDAGTLALLREHPRSEA